MSSSQSKSPLKTEKFSPTATNKVSDTQPPSSQTPQFDVQVVITPHEGGQAKSAQKRPHPPAQEIDSSSDSELPALRMPVKKEKPNDPPKTSKKCDKCGNTPHRASHGKDEVSHFFVTCFLRWLVDLGWSDQPDPSFFKVVMLVMKESCIRDDMAGFVSSRLSTMASRNSFVGGVKRFASFDELEQYLSDRIYGRVSPSQERVFILSFD